MKQLIPHTSIKIKRSGSGLCLHRIAPKKEAYKTVFGLWQPGWDESEGSEGCQTVITNANKQTECSLEVFRKCYPFCSRVHVNVVTVCFWVHAYVCACREEYRGSKIGRLFWPVISQLRDGLVILAGSVAMTEWPSRPHTGTCADLLWQDYKTAAFTGWVYSCVFHLFLTKTSGAHQQGRKGKKEDKNIWL